MERRLSAILAADMVGYSRLMEADEIGTLERQRVHRVELINPEITKYRGRIVKELGDGILVEFPSVVQAVQCAVTIQRQMPFREAEEASERRIQYRIGINLGDIVTEGDDIFGDGVNIAARLEQLADPDGICISGTTYDQLKSTVEVGYQSLGEVKVKNIGRPIRAYRVLTDPVQAGLNLENPARRWMAWPLVASLALAITIGYGIWWWSAQSNTQTEKISDGTIASSFEPSIAVLPFANLSGDASESYFAEGIAEDIATDLSNVAGLTVASISSARARKADPDNLKKIAARLGVSHLVEGTVRRSKNRIRITAKLIDPKSGNQIWAERFDRNPEDIFSIQDEITGRVIDQLSAIFDDRKLTIKKRAYTPDPVAYDYYLRGRAQRIPPTPENLKSAFASFNKAIEIDPKFAGGYSGAAFASILAASDSTNTPSSARQLLSNARKLSEKAVELDPEFGPGWSSLAETYLRAGQHKKGLEAIKKAIEFAPSDSLMRANYGRFLGYIGQANEGVEQVKQAMRMSPDSLPLLFFLGSNQRAAGSYLEAINSLVDHRKRLGGRIMPAPTLQLAAAYSQAGQSANAAKTVAALLKVTPGINVSKANRMHVYQSQEDVMKFSKALQNAGLPN